MTDDEREAVASEALRMSAEAQVKLWDRINANRAKIREREAKAGRETCLTQQ